MKIKGWVIGVIILLLFGILLSVIPMGTYYFSEPYQHAKYKGVLKNGSVINYYAFFAGFVNNHTIVSLGMKISVEIIENGQYNVSYTAYKIIGDSGMDMHRIPQNPFYGDYIEKIGKGLVKVNSTDPFISIIFPRGNEINILNHTIPINGTGFHTFINKINGYPLVYSDSYAYGFYVKFKNQYVTYDLDLSLTPSQIHKLLEGIYPKIKHWNGDSQIMAAICWGDGNTVPPQDWAGWFVYGFGSAFPINVSLIIAAIIIAIVYVRRGG